MSWTPKHLASQAGKTFVITGANSGIGLEATKILASHGARLVMACRSMDKAEKALAEVKAHAPGVDASLVQLDLASLASIKEAAAQIATRCPTIDALVNNAGIMAIPRRETADGFEMQLGTNHLGHFALTGQLLPHIVAAGGRVVSVSSNAHKMFARINFDDLMAEKKYSRWQVYGQSKLANMLFIFELQRRFTAAGSPCKAVACHPGYSGTNLQLKGAELRNSPLRKYGMLALNLAVSQSAEKGAWPTVRAATDPRADGAEYYGPQWVGEWRGPVGPAKVGKAARDEAVARRLWEVSEELTGVTYDFSAATTD